MRAAVDARSASRVERRQHVHQVRLPPWQLWCLYIVTVVPWAGCATENARPHWVYFPAPPDTARAVHLISFNRLSDLVHVHKGILELIRGGGVSPYVSTPAGLAYQRNTLYICDTSLNVVHVWNLRTGRGTRLGGPGGDLQLIKPVAVAVDRMGNVFIADTGRGEVVAFGADGRSRPGTFSVRRDPDRHGYRPVAVAVRGSLLYVADITAHTIDVFSIDDGSFLTTKGGIGSGPREFYFPMGVATDADGRVFVSDMMNGRVQVLDDHLEPTLTIGRPGNRYGDLGQPRHLAVGPDGVVFVADPEFAHVHLFNLRAQLLMLLGTAEDRPGGTPMPVSVAVAEKLPSALAALLPDNFRATYFLFVANRIGTRRLSLFAIGTATGRTPPTPSARSRH